jgi:hypothetical protein
MELLATQCQKAHTSRLFLELLHSKVNQQTDKSFSSRLKVILVSARQTPNMFDHLLAATPRNNSVLTGFTFGGNKRKASDSPPMSLSKLKKFRYQKSVLF